MRILIVGAGAVGQVYGRHLQRGGAQVAFFVRERYAAEVRAGLTLYPLNEGRDPARCRTRLEAPAYTDWTAVAAERWDQVWITVSSPALKAGTFLEDLARARGDAVVVAFQPGLEDRTFLRRHVPEDALVNGMISFLSWQAPLPGEALAPPGVMYWLPPLSPSAFSGPAAPTQAVVRALKAGGCPAKAAADVPAQTAIGSSALLTAMAALELAGWSLARFARERAPQAAAAGREAMAIAASYHRRRSPGWLLRGLVLSLGARLAPRLLPLPLEEYLRYHFSKVGDQTRESLQTWIRQGQTRGLPTRHLAEMERDLPA